MAFRQRNIRKKSAGPGEDEEGSDDGRPVIKPPQPSKPGAAVAAKAAGDGKKGDGGAKKPDAGSSKGPKANLLSFEDEGDDPGFVAKKDSKKDKQRSKLKAQVLLDVPAEPVGQTLRSTAGEYTQERMKELQRNAISFSTSRLAAAAEGGEAGAGGAAGREPVIKLSGSFKPAGAPKDDRYTMGLPTALVKPPEEEGMPLPPPPRPGGAVGAGTGAAAGAGAAGGGGGAAAAAEEEDDDDPSIPDQETILAAKAKRERLRQAHLAPDYLPTASLVLNRSKGGKGAGARGGSAGPGGSGEEGAAAGSGSDSEAEAEEQMRIKFSGKVDGARARDMKGMSRATGGDDDEEAFAQEQLRKALRHMGAQPPPGGAQQHAQAAAAAPHYPFPTAAADGGAGTAYPPPGSATAAAYGMASHPYPSNHMRGAGLHSAAYGGPYSGPAMVAGSGGGGRQAAIAGQGDAVMASLQEGLRRMQMSHKQVQLNLKRTGENLESSLQRIEGWEGDLKAAGERYLFTQALKAFVADLCDCLQVKSAIVEELEDSRLELMEDRAEARHHAAAAMDRDLMAPAQAAVSAAMSVLGRGGGAAAATREAEAAARDAEEALLDEEGPVELDEFGRNTNLQKRRELEERAAARKLLLGREGERMAAAQAGGAIAALDAEGDPGDEQAGRYATRYAEMVEAGATVFADADEEFAAIAGVKARLEEWKARYPKDYTNAYMHLSTPALFAPYVRLELLTWDPLYGTGVEAGAPYKGFDQQKWYGELFEYGMGGGANGADAVMAAEDDPDGELVPQLVRKLVLPLALHWIERCWDVRSAGQTRAVAALASELLVYVPAEEERMVELLSVVRGSLERAVEGSSLPPWPPAVLACSPTAARVLFRRFRLAVRLLHCVCAFEGLLSRSLLVGLAVGRLVGGAMLPYLRMAAEGGSALGFAVATVEAVAGALHPDWFSAGAPAEAGAFLEHVGNVARALEQQREDGSKAGLAARLVRVLGRLGERERSARLAKAFGIPG